MVIYFLRHGDVADYSVDDASRILSEKGEEQAAIVGKALVTLGLNIDYILSSPLSRAKQTADIVGDILHNQNIKTSEYLVPESNPRQLISELNVISHGSVLLVGHEPQLRSFSSYLLTDSLHMDILFRKASLSCITIGLPIRQGKGTLQWHITNEQMKLFNA